MSFDLDRFVAAQQGVYEGVLDELRRGRKVGHWIWFIFPQMAGLGPSAMAQRFGIRSRAMAQAYLKHPILGKRLRECTRPMLASTSLDISSILSYPDVLKFRSSMTLFAIADPEESMFAEALKKFFAGERDPLTVELLD